MGDKWVDEGVVGVTDGVLCGAGCDVVDLTAGVGATTGSACETASVDIVGDMTLIEVLSKNQYSFSTRNLNFSERVTPILAQDFRFQAISKTIKRDGRRRNFNSRFEGK